jgi:hypothetical protein
VIAYANKILSFVEKEFHLMEGDHECYALVWGIMHFRQYLYHNHFTLQTNHKPLEWLMINFYAYGRKGRWINTLQDFSFKIVHRARSKHTNVDALNRNLVNVIEADEDLVDEIQDYKMLQAI